MATEVERKFLVAGAFPESDEVTEIVQAYLCLDPKRTVRIRIESGVATINVKGKTVGASRLEFEYPIPVWDAREMIQLTAGESIKKIRHRIPVGKFTWEVDVFEGANGGLIVAEIELPSESAIFELPDWVGDEVTDDHRYFNAALVQNPYSTW